MNRTEQNFSAMLTMYKTLRDTDEILNSEYFDAVSYDIDGYESTFNEYSIEEDYCEIEKLYEELKKQVSHVSKLVIATKNLNFKFG